MKLPLEIIGIVFHLNKTEHIEHMPEKPSRLRSLGPGVEVLGDQKHQPHDFAVKKSQGEGEYTEDQLVSLEPEYLDGS